MLSNTNTLHSLFYYDEKDSFFKVSVMWVTCVIHQTDCGYMRTESMVANVVFQVYFECKIVQY